MALERHRDKNGEISRKHGNTLIGTLRKTYGADFAKNCAADMLSDVLHKMDEPSLSKLVHDHQAGKLEQFVSRQLNSPFCCHEPGSLVVAVDAAPARIISAHGVAWRQSLSIQSL